MPNKLTIDIFIERSNKIHNNKYDYTLVEYKNSKTKVKIICPIHGVFEQIPNSHLLGFGCYKCSIEELSKNMTKTTKKFITDSKNIHYNKYDYSLVDYKGNKTKVKIICPHHGVFEQTPNNHLSGYGCPTCGGTKQLTKLDFIKRANKIHNFKYNYLIDNYENMHINIKILCPIHGEFTQKPYLHLNGQGCPLCRYILSASKLKMNLKDFIERSNIIHNNKYDYSLVKYKNSKTKVKIICPHHGVFEQTPNAHLSKQSCPVCKESKGEKQIRNILIKNNIKYISQKKFIGCKNILPLPFDFYLPYYNICIEFDGKQHYEPNDFFGGIKTLEKQKINDELKNIFCNKNNIKLIRIKYNDDINNLLNLIYI